MPSLAIFGCGLIVSGYLVLGCHYAFEAKAFNDKSKVSPSLGLVEPITVLEAPRVGSEQPAQDKGEENG